MPSVWACYCDIPVGPGVNNCADTEFVDVEFAGR